MGACGRSKARFASFVGCGSLIGGSFSAVPWRKYSHTHLGWHEGVEMFCRFNQTDPCYTALGHKLYLQMVLDTHNVVLEFKKGTDSEADPVFTVKKDKLREGIKYESFRSRSEFIFNNGTLIINSVIRSDSGTYRLEIYNSVGEQTYTNNLQVIVEAPIGSVKVSINCSSSGEKRVSCSSEGDQLIFNWTLNGQKLEDGNNTIHLDEETSGNITCTVKNHVSHGQNTTSVNRCPGTTTATVTSHLTSTVTSSTQTSGHGMSFTDHTTAGNTTGIHSDIQSAGAFPQVSPVTLIIFGSTTLIFILLIITVCNIYKKKKQLKPTAESDVEYAVVSCHMTKRKKMNEEEVQYGEVTFTPTVSNSQQEDKEQEDYVYSEVLIH
ncbi:uncharacterized protein LOC127412760 isoform X1 [Myxocyprinus asiaticus]|uniref:uncharacterized protein LOC127412760 isoform X1 n=1 Tax=Myxocyprinus asiaticus TaxID=70543 RepID=UPI002223DBCB|nr:uncharacterized protein LOC127412760 isoform X1 [Myxocyprinus asiaticus]